MRKKVKEGGIQVEFRKFIVYKVTCPKMSPIGSSHMDLNSQPCLKEQIEVKWSDSNENKWSFFLHP